MLSNLLRLIKRIWRKSKIVTPRILNTRYGKSGAVYQIYDPQAIALFRIVPYSDGIGDCQYIFKLDTLPQFKKQVLGEIEGETVELLPFLPEDSIYIYSLKIFALFRNGSSKLLYGIQLSSSNSDIQRVESILVFAVRAIAYRSIQIKHRNTPLYTWRSLMGLRIWNEELARAIIEKQKDLDIKDQIIFDIQVIYEVAPYH